MINYIHYFLKDKHITLSSFHIDSKSAVAAPDTHRSKLARFIRRRIYYPHPKVRNEAYNRIALHKDRAWQSQAADLHSVKFLTSVLRPNSAKSVSKLTNSSFTGEKKEITDQKKDNTTEIKENKSEETREILDADTDFMKTSIKQEDDGNIVSSASFTHPHEMVAKLTFSPSYKGSEEFKPLCSYPQCMLDPPDPYYRCSLCSAIGNCPIMGRMLPIRPSDSDVVLWVHTGCAYWSTEVIIGETGRLVDVMRAIKRGRIKDSVCCSL